MAQVDYHLKLEGIKGESKDAKHKDEIEIHSWSFGATNSGSFASGGGGGAGKVVMGDIHFTTNAALHSPKILLACCQGEHIKSAVLTCRKAGKDQQEYLKITLSDILVSSYRTSGSGGQGIIPLDEFTLNFAKIEKEYKEQKEDGSMGGVVKATYNLKTNKAE